MDTEGGCSSRGLLEEFLGFSWGFWRERFKFFMFFLIGV